MLEELSPNPSSTTTFVPVDNEALSSKIRALITKEDALDLISRVGSIPEAEWPRDNRLRSEKFRRIIDSGDKDGIVALIKAIWENGKRRIA